MFCAACYSAVVHLVLMDGRVVDLQSPLVAVVPKHREEGLGGVPVFRETKRLDLLFALGTEDPPFSVLAHWIHGELLSTGED